MTGARTQWQLLQGAVKGGNKKFSQDAKFASSIAGGSGAVLSVADGHGSAPHPFSDIGARWAVDAFASCALAFSHRAVSTSDGDSEHPPLPLLRQMARSLPRQVDHYWRQRIAVHESNSAAGGGTLGGPAPHVDFRPYGSTLIGAVVTTNLLVAWQLGDGDLVTVDADGQVFLPLYQGEEYGDETDSMCLPEAWRRVRIHWQPLAQDRTLRAVLLSTDGLSKSFTDHQGFVDFADGVHRRVGSKGLPTIREQLEGWLNQAASYSGDDATLVAAFSTADFPA